MRRMVVCVFCILACACGGDSSGSGPAAPSSPAPANGTLSGRVTESVGGSVYPIAGAELTIVDGANAGKATTTTATGDYSLTELRRQRFEISISANGYTTGSFSVELTADLTRNFTLESNIPRRPFAAGQYKIGIDIPAGRYFSDPSQSGCYWERQRGLSGTVGDIIANRFVTYDAGQYIVDILRSDVAFKTDAKCGTWSDTPSSGVQSSIPPGIWLVGSQIAPGTYEASPKAGCYWERLRHFQHQGVGGVIQNGFSGAGRTQTITIAAGDAGFLSDGNCGTWTPSSSPQAFAESQQSTEAIEHHRSLYEQHTARR